MKKKLHVLEIISIGIILFTMIAFVSTFLFYGIVINPVFDTIVVGLMMVSIFGVPGMTVIGMILNSVSLVKRRKRNSSVTINIVLYAVFVLLLPIWWQFFWNAIQYV